MLGLDLIQRGKRLVGEPAQPFSNVVEFQDFGAAPRNMTGYLVFITFKQLFQPVGRAVFFSSRDGHAVGARFLPEDACDDLIDILPDAADFPPCWPVLPRTA